jgi:hypothetical protein
MGKGNLISNNQNDRSATMTTTNATVNISVYICQDSRNDFEQDLLDMTARKHVVEDEAEVKVSITLLHE